MYLSRVEITLTSSWDCFSFVSRRVQGCPLGPLSKKLFLTSLSFQGRNLKGHWHSFNQVQVDDSSDWPQRGHCPHCPLQQWHAQQYSDHIALIRTPSFWNCFTKRLACAVTMLTTVIVFLSWTTQLFLKSAFKLYHTTWCFNHRDCRTWELEEHCRCLNCLVCKRGIEG